MQEFAAGKFHFEPPFTSLDHLVGEQRRRDFKAKSLCFEVHDQLDFRDLLDRQVTLRNAMLKTAHGWRKLRREAQLMSVCYHARNPP